MKLQFHTPPANQGQIVEVSYAMTADGHVIQRVNDRSGGVAYYISPANPDDDGDYWQQTPPNTEWREPTTDELKRYGLA